MLTPHKNDKQTSAVGTGTALLKLKHSSNVQENYKLDDRRIDFIQLRWNIYFMLLHLSNLQQNSRPRNTILCLVNEPRDTTTRHGDDTGSTPKFTLKHNKTHKPYSTPVSQPRRTLFCAMALVGSWTLSMLFKHTSHIHISHIKPKMHETYSNNLFEWMRWLYSNKQNSALALCCVMYRLLCRLSFIEWI